MKRFASAQQEHASLRAHTGIAEKILFVTKHRDFAKRLEAEQSLLAGFDPYNEYIEDCINKKEPLVKVLRLLCLQSLTCGGIKQKQYEIFTRAILQGYGFEYLFTLNNLEKLGLLKKQEGKNNFSTLRKNLNLVVEEIDENNPNDIAYVYSGYAPLSVRLIQCALKPGGWKMREDIMKLLPGPTIEETQPLPAAIQEKGANRNKVTLVFMIGGVTFTELAALRWMSKQEDQYGDIIVASTKIINGNSLLSSIMENVQSVSPNPNPQTTQK